MTKKQTIAKLAETRTLSTGMLKPLGISFESFLRLAQLSKPRADAIIDQLIKTLQNGGKVVG